MSDYPIIPAFDLQPRDTLCQCVELLRAKWQPRRLLGPLVESGRHRAAQSGSWPLPQERRQRLEIICGEWISWLEDTGLGVVAGHVLAVTAASARGEAREVNRLDMDLDRMLSPELAGASREGGATLLLACDGLRHGGVLGRMQQRWLEGGPCHWGTAWGALAALFSMPPAGAALVALFSEWEALDPLERRSRPIGEVVAWFARDSGPSLAGCQWIENRMRREFLRIA